ncbi:MAG: hypothetical protein LBR00_05500 [Clostridiales Family XIII bacterium]|jgi:SSS family solute:Na+ symporter|nr:hypothetical protein [Clostridiales Family XIII bacterium]
MTLAVALIYFAVLIIGAGIYAMRKVKTSGDFTSAEGQGGMSWIFITCSFVLIPLGSGHSMSLWEQSYGPLGGGALLWALAVGAIFLPIMMLFFGPLARSTGFKTFPEITKAMYGRVFGWLHAAISASSLSGIIAAELIGTGVAIYALSGGSAGPFADNMKLPVIIAFVFALLYIFFGGFLQMAWINIVNAIMLIAGSFAALIGVVIWLGENYEFGGKSGLAGVAAFYASDPATNDTVNSFGAIIGEYKLNQFANLLSGNTLLDIFIPVTLLHLCSIAVSQGHNMPFFAARSNKDIRKGVYLASGINAISAVPWVAIGLVAVAVPAVMGNVGSEVGKLLVPEAALAMLPAPITGLLMISLLSATLSTAASITLGAAQQVTTSIIKDAVKPDMSDKTQLLTTRIMCLVYLLICLVMALNLPVIMPVFFFCFMLSIPLFFCYVTGMFITINKVTCYLTLIVGYIFAFWWTFAPPANAPYPFDANGTTYVVVLSSFIVGMVIPLFLSKTGAHTPLRKIIKDARGEVAEQLSV